MCDICACPIAIPSEICNAQQQTAIANATERLKRMQQETERLKVKTNIEKERTVQEQQRLNFEERKSQINAQNFQTKSQINTEKSQQLSEQLAFEQEKTKALTEKLKALAGRENQKALQASQTWEFEKINTEFQNQKYLKQAEEWTIEMQELETKICQQKKLLALKYGY